MKLLTPTQKQSIEKSEEIKKIFRNKELEDAELKKRTALAKAEADFASMLEGQRARWINEELEHNKDIIQRKKEIEELEKKKLNLLIPIDIINQKADEKLKESEKFLSELKIRESKNEELSELLENKLDELGEREENIKSKEDKIKLKEISIKNQEDVIKFQSEKLTFEIQDFYNKKSKEEKEIETKKTENILIEQSLKSKEENLSIKEKTLNELSIRLRDERQVLDSAWEELEKKKLFQ